MPAPADGTIAAVRDWPPGTLFSPLSGAPLQACGPSVLAAGGEVWPVIEGIPFLRADRVRMARAAVDLIEAGDIVAATALLLTDQDPYAPDPPPDIETCARLVRDDACGFREAMRRLAFGRVADYFAHRWTDPTYLSGLALLGETRTRDTGRPVLELAAGVGHFLRAAARAGVEVVGADIVFAKLWLARRFVCPQARLVCFDAAVPWPLAEDAFAEAFCHDAFYFLPDKPGIAARMRRAVGECGGIAIGHAHNALADNHSAGQPLTVDAYAALFPGARLFDDRELTRAFAEGRPPEAAGLATLATVPALSLVWHGGDPGRPDRRPGGGACCRFGDEADDARLRLNPLYRRDGGRDGGEAAIVWPSPRYEQEYAALATYPMTWDGPDEIAADRSAATQALIRRRVYVDLPPRW